VHSSDLHVDHDYTARLHGGDGAAGLASVLNAARDVAADVVLLAGDTFENHRVPQDLIERAAAMMAAAAVPIIVLPGNHVAIHQIAKASGAGVTEAEAHARRRYFSNASSMGTR
jgi:predicted MPP superfamily phosphohydrolase